MPTKKFIGTKPTDRGTIAVRIFENEAIHDLEFDAEQTGQLIASLIGNAVLTARQSGLEPLPDDHPTAGMIASEVSAIGALQYPSPDSLLLVVHAGRSQFGLRLDKETAIGFAQKLLALTASEGLRQ